MIKICATCHGRGQGPLYQLKPFSWHDPRLSLADIVGSKLDHAELKVHLCRTCGGLGYVHDGTLSEVQDVARGLVEVLCEQVRLVMLVRAARDREVRLREELRDFAEELESRSDLIDCDSCLCGRSEVYGPCWECPHEPQCPQYVCAHCFGCDELEE